MREYKHCTKRLIMFKLHGSLLYPNFLHPIYSKSILKILKMPSWAKHFCWRLVKMDRNSN